VSMNAFLDPAASEVFREVTISMFDRCLLRIPYVLSQLPESQP
jgi:hypothetical protein